MEYEVVIAVAYTSESGSNVIMSTPKKSPTEKEKSHSKFKDFFGSMQNLSDKNDKQEKIEKKHKETGNSKSQSSKRKSPGGSSNEDLSDSTEASTQKSHVKSRLRKFFAKRPPMEVLVKKGIYKDEPVFGKNLSQVCLPDPANPGAPLVPAFVKACISEIESSEENMCTDGLYRASGNLSQVQKIRLEIDQNNLSVIEYNTDIHVLTGSLKLVTQYSERNRMHTANLAIVFGPTLLWAPAEQAHNIAIDCIQQNNVVDILLTEFKEIFEDNKGRRKS
ncbi:hypothetical protein MSG28_005572 [Choristoneura fumiferana]|uniref:Uncharacterized protein n=1 Tax=Choristoneura fumiferana TaxID=7141 RepID=A0ACC0L0B7_CHOFU|nr:hypothetical protein MSG28_005572 [Choristoneura fumiferana]